MNRLRRSITVVRDVLREIFDESAYARYLEKHHLISSPQAYAGFLREYELAKARRPRCC
jgi:hypothetical protein